VSVLELVMTVPSDHSWCIKRYCFEDLLVRIQKTNWHLF